MKRILTAFFILTVSAFAAQTAVPMSSGEKKVDTKLSPSLQPITDVPGLPRVLLIGDSISMGYTLRVRALLEGKANVHRAPTNCGPTVKGLAEMDRWLGDGRWDVIHFNFGLHDLKFLKPGVQAVPVEQYEKNLRVLVDKMARTGAKLIWATTTPVPAKTKAGQFPRNPGDIAAYNAAAARVIAGRGIATDDLYTAVESRLAELQNPMDVHFNSRGCDVLAAEVARSISAMLPESGKANEPRIAQQEPRLWSCDFKSKALGGVAMRFLVVLPEGASLNSPPQPVIYFLHGRGRHERTLLENPLTRPRLLASPVAVVLPRGREGWYFNSPAIPADRYADYVDEVMALAEKHFPLGGSARMRAIGGWSMGGYGAIYTACRRPEAFAAAASIIGILDFPRPAIEEKGQNYTVPPRFGEDVAFWETVNPRRLLPKLKPLPLFVAYADRAPERQMNEVFLADASTLGVSVETLRLSGGHTFPMVEQSFPAVMSFLEGKLRPASAP